MIDDARDSRPNGGELARFTRDLTAEARAGRLEPVRCRGDEIDRVIDILLRHGKNNPVLVGPAGVGQDADMSVVKINVVTMPEDKRARFEERFKGRAGAVEARRSWENRHR